MFRRKSTISSPRTKVNTVSLLFIRRQIHQFVIKGTHVLVKIKCGVESFKCWLLYETYQNALNF